MFSELDAGKIIVISFIEPCNACVGPTQNAYNIVQGYATSNPGKGFFYISDDQANTPCSSLISWANGNGMPGVTLFSDSAVKESDYGKQAMPKLVVLAGTDHKVQFVGDDAFSDAFLHNAIDNTINPMGIAQIQTENTNISLFPNPNKGSFTLDYTLSQESDVNIEVLNFAGAIVKTINKGKQMPGIYQQYMEIEIPVGIYFIKLSTTKGYIGTRLIINK